MVVGPEKIQKYELLLQARYKGYGKTGMMMVLVFLMTAIIAVMFLYLIAYVVLFWNLGLHAS